MSSIRIVYLMAATGLVNGRRSWLNTNIVSGVERFHVRAAHYVGLLWSGK